MPIVVGGPKSWEMSRNEDGDRTYKVTYRVQMDDTLEGPFTALTALGLPNFGDYWIIDGEADLWAWCRWEVDVKPVLTDEPNLFFDCTYTFSTKPPDENSRACKDVDVTDPLLEPPKINGSYVVYSEEATADRFGNPIINSAFERLRGPQIEFDANRLQVKIEMNVANLDLAGLGSMLNTVNDAPLWNYPPRCVKFSECEFERRYYGQCYYYFTLHMTFDCRMDSFDRDLLDESTKVLNGHWDGVSGAWVLDNINGHPPDATNPQHFIRWKDKQGENMKGILNGRGLPAGVQIGTSTSSSIYFINPGPTVTTNTPPAAPWVAVLAPISHVSEEWDGASKYQSGAVVTVSPLDAGAKGPTIYLCILPNIGVAPYLPFGANYWLKIDSALEDFTVTSKGIYKSGTSYDPGDYVSMASSTVEGFIHLEKYGESDLTQLGIPLSF